VVLGAGDNQYLTGGSIYRPPAFPDSAEPWVTLINRNGSTAWEKTFGPCLGDVVSVEALPESRFDVLYYISNGTPCNEESGVYMDTTLNAEGNVTNRSIIHLPSDCDPETDTIFVIPADSVRKTERMFVIPRFVSAKTQTAGMDLEITTADRFSNRLNDAIIPWTSDPGYVNTYIDAIETTSDGGIVVLGKTYYY
jgi:hypothetical protein